jgi:hypothetical protein
MVVRFFIISGGFMAFQTRRAAAWASITLALVLTLAGCGGGKIPGGQGATSPGSKDDKAKLAQLEASGAIPQLDRLPTLQGMDANLNGVRDDIESYIYKKYPEPKQRAAAMQMARAMQSMVTVDVRDPVAVNAAARAGSLAGSCLWDKFPHVNEISVSSVVLTEIESMTTNTKERLLAYLAYNKALSGSVWSLPKGDTCE